MADIGNAVGKITIDSSGVVAGVEAAQKALSGLDAAADKAMAGLAAAIEKGGDAAQKAVPSLEGFTKSLRGTELAAAQSSALLGRANAYEQQARAALAGVQAEHSIAKAMLESATSAEDAARARLRVAETSQQLIVAENNVEKAVAVTAEARLKQARAEENVATERLKIAKASGDTSAAEQALGLAIQKTNAALDESAKAAATAADAIADTKAGLSAAKTEYSAAARSLKELEKAQKQAAEEMEKTSTEVVEAKKAFGGLDDAVKIAANAVDAAGRTIHAATSRMRSGIESLSAGLKNMQAAASRAMDAMSTAVKGGLLAAGAGFVAAAGAGFKFNSSLEQVEAKLTAFLKDGQLVASTLEMIRTRAANTPFAFEEMANAAAALVPSAKQAGVSLEQLIQTAEILAASNPAEGLEGAAVALREAVSGDFVSVIERFNLPRQRLNELKAEGVPALEAVGIAMQELGLDAELVTNMANTAVGRWSTIMDTLVGYASALTQPVFDAISAGAGRFIEVLAQLQPIIDGIVLALSGFIENLVAGAPFVDSLRAAVVQAAEALGYGRTEALNIGLALTNLIVSLQEAWLSFTNLIDPITDLVTQFVTMKDVLIVVGGIVAGVVVSALASLAAAAAPVLIVFGALVLAVAALRTAWEENFAGIQEMVAGVWEGLQLAFEGIKQLLEGDLAGAMESFGQAWETGWTAIVEFIGTLWGMIEGHLLTLWESIKGWFDSQPWGEIGAAVAAAIVAGLSAFGELVTAKLDEWEQVFLNWAQADTWAQVGNDFVKLIQEGAGGAFKEFETHIFQNGIELVGRLLDGLATFATSALATLTGWTTTLTGWVSGYDWSQLGFDVTTAIISGLKGFVALVAGAGGVLETWRQGFVTWAMDIENWKALGQAVVDGIIAGWKFTAAVKNAINQFFLGVIKAIRDALGLDTAMPVTMKTGQELVHALGEGMLSRLQEIVDVGKAIVDGLKTGIEGKIREAAEWGARMVRAVIDAARGEAQSRSPSRVTMAFGEDLTDGLAIGIEKNLAGLKQSGASMANAISGGFSTMAGAGGGAMEHLDSLMAAIRAGVAAFGNLTEQTKAYVELLGSVVGVFKEAVDLIATLQGVTNLTSVEPVVLWINYQLLAMARAIQGGVNAFGGSATALTKPYIELVNAAVSTFKEAIATIVALQGVTNLTSVEPVVLWINYQLLAMARAIQGGVNAFGNSMTAQTKSYIELIKEIISLIAAGVAALAAIGTFVPIENATAKIELFVEQLIGLTTAFATGIARLGEAVQGDIQLAAELSPLVKQLLEVVKTAVDALAAISKFVLVENLKGQLNSFVAQTVSLLGSFANGLANINSRIVGQIGTAAELSPAVKELLGVVKTAVDSLAAIFKFVPVANLKGQLDGFVSQTVAVLGSFSNGLANINSRIAGQIGVAAGLAPAVKEILGVIKTAVDALGAIGDFAGVANLKETLAMFVEQLVQTVIALTTGLNAGLLGLEEALASAGNLSGLAKDVLETVKRGVDSLASLKDFVGVENLEAILALFGQQLIRTVIALTTGLNAGLAGMEESLASAGNLSGLAKDVLETVKRGVDSLLALAEFTGVASLSSTLDAFVAQLVYTVQRLTIGLNTGLAGMEEALASAGNLSGLAKDVLESVKRGVDSLTALGEFKPVENLAETLTVFSAQFTSAVRIVTNTLNNIATTIGQGALTAAAGIAETVKSISDSVLASIRSINALAESEEPLSLQGIMNKVAAAIGVSIPNIAANGLAKLVAAITEQLAALPVAFHNAGILAADGLANVLISSIPALQSLAASIGMMISNEIAAGILANQATIAQAITVVAGAGAAGVGTPPPGGDTINNTSVNMFGGQSFGSSSSPRSITDEFSRLR